MACTPAWTSDSDAPLPTAWDVDGPTDTAPVLTADDATAALADIFSRIYTYNADVLFLAYAEAMTWSDASCPPIASGESGSMWDTVGCTTETGADFSGFVSAFIGTQGDTDVQVMRGEATINLPDGTALTIAGDASTQVQPGTWMTEIAGVMRYDGAASVGTWVEDQPDLNLQYTLETSTEDGDGFDSLTVDGSISGLEGAVTAVAFDGLSIDGRSTCSTEPSGTVSLRDVDGVWASITFDPEVTCDGCASLVFEDTDLGQACADTSEVTGAELPPW